LLLDQQVKVYVFSAVRWEQDFFSLASHEKSKLFSGFSTFQTFQESMARRDSLSLSASLKSTNASVCFRGISRLEKKEKKLNPKAMKRKKVKPEGSDYLQKTHHNWTKANELQRSCFKQDTKANQRWVKAM